MLQAFAIKDSQDHYIYNSMRVYFGAYPKKGSSPHMPNGQNGYPTILFVPAKAINKCIEDDQDDVTCFYFADEKWKFKTRP